jgi:hypothetical protein
VAVPAVIAGNTDGFTVIVKVIGDPVQPVPADIKLPNEFETEFIGMVDTIVPVTGLTIDTVLTSECNTYNKPLTGFTDTPVGPAPPNETLDETEFVAVLIIDKVPEVVFVTYTWLPAAFMEMPEEPKPVGIVAVTVLVKVFTTDMLLEALSTTYNRVPSGLMVKPIGPLPTGMVFINALVAVFITETVLTP